MANTTKLRIDLTQGTLDVEGTERFVKDIYKEFKQRLDGSGGRRKSASTGRKKPGRKKTPGRKAGASKPQIVKDLNLTPQGKQSLKEFYKSFKKLSRNEKFLVYVIYLKDVLKLEQITADHVFTCMKEVGDKVPATLKQIISNAKTKTGWFQSKSGNITYTDAGKKYYESELKKKLKK